MRESTMGCYHVRDHCQASSSAVWALLMDATSWPSWTPLDELVAADPEVHDEDGNVALGTVRTFRTGKAVTSERITGLTPCRHLAYEGFDNFVLHAYQAAIDLVPAADGGTDICWHGVFTTRPGIGAFMSLYMQRFQRRMIRGLAAAAEASTSR